MVKLSTFVELLNLSTHSFKWQFQRGLEGKGFTNNGRTDQGPYPERGAALTAAAKALEEKLGQSVTIDDPPETLCRLSQRDISLPGEKRRRTGGHGYSGGDGFIRLG